MNRVNKEDITLKQEMLMLFWIFIGMIIFSIGTAVFLTHFS